MKRLLVAVLVVLGLVVALAAPAGAVPSPYTRTDPITGENVYAKNDLKSMRIVHDDTVTLILRTETGVNPATHAAWKAPNGTTSINWTLDGPETGAFFVLNMRSTPTGPSDPVITGAFAQTCDGDEITFTYLAPNGYQFAFPRSCVLNTATIRAYATYRFNPVGTPAAKTDRIPNSGYTPQVSPAP